MANSTPVMKKAQEYPLYSLVIQAYKQEKYIRQTLKGAFDQTYPNLEIIVCDDASPDHTWEIIEEEVRNYKGPHKIILHKNAENLAIAGAASLAMKLPLGEVIIWNDGDDISEPNRVMRIYEEFTRLGAETMMLWCDNLSIDALSNPVYEKHIRLYKRHSPVKLQDIKARTLGSGMGPGGTNMAWKRIVSDSFPPISKEFLGWDFIITFRALLIGRIAHIQEKLIRYRTHPESTTNSGRPTNLKKEYEKRAKGDCCFIQYFAQHLIDISTIAAQTQDPKLIREYTRIEFIIQNLIRRQIVSFEIMSNFPNLSLKTLWKAIPYPGFHRHFIYAILYKLGFYHK